MRDGWPPTCSRASTSEVNSWPIGIAGEADLHVGADAADQERRLARVIVAAREIFGDSAAISPSSVSSSRAASESSSEATSSIGCCSFSR